MARTKQTARCSYAAKVPRRQLVAQSVARRTAPQSRSRSRSPSQESKKSIDVSTSQFSVKFDNQKECEAKAVAPNLISCSNCSAFLSSFSQAIGGSGKRSLRSMDDAQKQLQNSVQGSAWECEFCKTVNQIGSNFEGLPQENQCYLLEKAKSTGHSSQAQKGSMLIYCIDISGSMDMVYEKKSRLEAVKEAITDELKRMKSEKNNTEIAIVTFGSNVTVYNQDSVVVPAHLYNNFEGVVEYAKEIKDFSFTLSKKFKDLKEYVDDLCTYGSTALGPGLLLSIQLASRGRKGSKIILCTDGEANIGLNGPDFYSRAALYAKQKGVVVNILSIKGDRCNLKQLGKLTLSTGGSILKIDPNLLGSEFNKISKEEVLGSESTLKIVVNQLFEIETKVGQLSKDKTTLTQNYGSFTADTELTFNFKVLSREEAVTKGVPYDKYMGKKALMQVQLTYTSPTGAKYLQVITDYRQLSQNKEDALREMNFGLFAASTLQRISTLIKDANFDEASNQIKTYDRMVLEVFSKKESKKELDKFNKRVRELERILNSKKSKKDRSRPPSKTKNAASKSKAKPVLKKQAKKTKMRRKARRGSDSQQSQSESLSNPPHQYLEEAASIMASDSEQQVLYREMRARSRSHSVD